MSNQHKSQWIIGNTFPFVVFGTFGAFWLTFGFTNVPFYNATGAFVTETYTTGAENPEFNASFGKLCACPEHPKHEADSFLSSQDSSSSGWVSSALST
jgi:hypothetical protein